MVCILGGYNRKTHNHAGEMGVLLGETHDIEEKCMITQAECIFSWGKYMYRRGKYIFVRGKYILSKGK